MQQRRRAAHPPGEAQTPYSLRGKKGPVPGARLPRGLPPQKSPPVYHSFDSPRIDRHQKVDKLSSKTGSRFSPDCVINRIRGGILNRRIFPFLGKRGGGQPICRGKRGPALFPLGVLEPTSLPNWGEHLAKFVKGPESPRMEIPPGENPPPPDEGDHSPVSDSGGSPLQDPRAPFKNSRTSIGNENHWEINHE